jgi:hypothetical protein
MLADFADHLGGCHGAVLAGGLHGVGFEVGASLLTSPYEVWKLVGRGLARWSAVSVCAPCAVLVVYVVCFVWEGLYAPCCTKSFIA